MGLRILQELRSGELYVPLSWRAVRPTGFCLTHVLLFFYSTVDAFQGREAGIVIFSCVRSSCAGIGFLSDVQRMNVALTRAKHFLFVIARQRSIMVNPYWRKLVGFARSKNAIIQVPVDLDKQRTRTKELRSSLIKSSSTRKVSFGVTSERTYEVDSRVNSDSKSDGPYPDLTRLTPTHSSAQLDGKMGESDHLA